MKKKLWIGIPIILLIVGFAIVIIYNQTGFQLKINGEKIDKEEYLDTVNEQINEVSQYFYEKAGITLKGDSWEKEIEGEVPYRVLTDQVIEQLKYSAAVFDLAKEKGYIKETGYQALKKRMEDENEARANKIKKGEPVYGLSNFSLKLYKEYSMDAIQKQYCSDLDNEGMKVTDEERQVYYDQQKDKIFRQNDDITLEFIKIEYLASGMDEAQYRNLKDKMTELHGKISDKEQLSDLIQREELLMPYYTHQELLSGDIGAYSRIMGDVLDYAADLKKGEVTRVIDENGTLYLIQCTDRNVNDYYPLDAVKDNINKSLREANYESILTKKAAGYEVLGNMDRIYAYTKQQVMN
ncbi:peptidyl-prolyl cis-trans isomerase [uncultured Robinsoniella sp.]|uniref:peptidylprolyl isomerase n=1 Tax=Robinsoniella sp. TaxID=2496533 RepID=UPI00374E92DF